MGEWVQVILTEPLQNFYNFVPQLSLGSAFLGPNFVSINLKTFAAAKVRQHCRKEMMLGKNLDNFKMSLKYKKM